MPQVFISYSHLPNENLDRVLALANRLRAGGVDCIIDQYEQSPAKGWPQWCADQVAQATFVLVVCNQTYLQRFNGEEVPNIGKGTTWEGHIITQELYKAQGRNTKFIPITFTADDSHFIRGPLESATCYHLDEGYENLYRRLTEQPAIVKPALGPVQPMLAREPIAPLPALERKQTFQTIWTIPYSRNPFFTGREQILSDLHQALATRNRAALTGFGGLGKTQAAIEYAYRHRSHYKAVFWLKAETRNTSCPISLPSPPPSTSPRPAPSSSRSQSPPPNSGSKPTTAGCSSSTTPTTSRLPKKSSPPAIPATSF
jgi:hypothetical protein